MNWTCISYKKVSISVGEEHHISNIFIAELFFFCHVTIDSIKYFHIYYGSVCLISHVIHVLALACVCFFAVICAHIQYIPLLIIIKWIIDDESKLVFYWGASCGKFNIQCTRISSFCVSHIEFKKHYNNKSAAITENTHLIEIIINESNNDKKSDACRKS